MVRMPRTTRYTGTIVSQSLLLRRLRAVGTHLAVIAGFLALALFHLRPIGTSLRAGVIGGAEDAWMNVFHVWWLREAFVEGLWPWHSPYLHYPIGSDMYWHTLAIAKAAWGIVLVPFMDPIVAYNLIVIGSIVATGYAAWLLCRHLCARVTDSRAVAAAAAFAGACVFAFSPYAISKAWGHLNLVSMEGIPIFLLLYIKFMETGHRRYVWLALPVALYVIACDYYYFVYLATFIAFDLGRVVWKRGFLLKPSTWLHEQSRRAFTMGLALVLGGAPILALLLWHAFPAPVSNFHGNSDYFLDLTGVFIPFQQSAYFAWLPTVLRKLVMMSMPFAVREEAGFYLGWAVMGLAAVAVAKGLPWARRLAGIGGVFLLLSFGVALSAGGTTQLRVWVVALLAAMAGTFCLPRRSWSRNLVFVLLAISALDLFHPFTVEQRVATVTVPMPYLIFKNVFPFFNRGGYPMRFVLMAYLALSVCFALSAAWLAGRRRQWVVAPLLVLLIAVPNLDYLTGPMGVTPPAALSAEVVAQIAAEPPDVAVLTDNWSLSQYEIILHRHPVSMTRVAREALDEAMYFRAPLYLAVNGLLPLEKITPEDLATMRTLIRERHYKYLILHFKGDKGVQLAQRLGGKLLYSNGALGVWQLYDN